MSANNNTARKGIRIIEGYLHKDDPQRAEQPTRVASDRNGFYVNDGLLYDYIESVADIDDISDFGDLVDFINSDTLDPATAGMTDPDDIAGIDRYRTAREQGAEMYLVHYVDSDPKVVNNALYFERPTMYDDAGKALLAYPHALAEEAGLRIADIDGYPFPFLFGFSSYSHLIEFWRRHRGHLYVMANLGGEIILRRPFAEGEYVSLPNGAQLLVDGWAFVMDNSSASNWTAVTTRNTTREELSERFAGSDELLRAYDDLGKREAILIDLNDPNSFKVMPGDAVQIDAPEGTYYLGMVM